MSLRLLHLTPQNILDSTFNRLFQIGDQAGDTIRIGLGSVDTASLGWRRPTRPLSDPVDMCWSLRVSRATLLGGDPVDSTLAGTTTADSVTGIFRGG